MVDAVQRRGMFCSHTAQECTLHAQIVLMIHSNYDIEPHDLADALALSGCSWGAGTFLFTADILMSDTGTIPNHQCVWEKFVSGGRQKFGLLFVIMLLSSTYMTMRHIFT